MIYVGVFLCMCLYVYVFLWERMCICECVRECVLLCVCVHVHISASLYIQVFVAFRRGCGIPQRWSCNSCEQQMWMLGAKQGSAREASALSHWDISQPFLSQEVVKWQLEIIAHQARWTVAHFCLGFTLRMCFKWCLLWEVKRQRRYITETICRPQKANAHSLANTQDRLCLCAGITTVSHTHILQQSCTTKVYFLPIMSNQVMRVPCLSEPMKNTSRQKLQVNMCLTVTVVMRWSEPNTGSGNFHLRVKCTTSARIPVTVLHLTSKEMQF